MKMHECEVLEAMLKNIDDKRPGLAPTHQELYVQTAKAVVELFNEHRAKANQERDRWWMVDASLNVAR